ncbi:MAG: preprotein translocase subunit SecE [Coprobacillus sp.]|nr:preprotein translocase subunit SecE [Coprobacillus sp.]MDY4146063.1 preprotein translocase subunit SecE [Bacilli bacterium]CCY07740.1 integral membrane protein [Coprobacillus sp. CAG:698]
MAEKEKKSLMSLLGKEYKYEGLLLLVLGIITTVLGVLIHLGVTTKGSEGLVINENFYFIGEYPKLFAWVLIILGAAAIILAIYPYYKPSIKEMKRITWPSKKEMLSNTLIVIAFIVIVAFLFLGYDAILNQVVKLFKYLGNLMR